MVDVIDAGVLRTLLMDSDDNDVVLDDCLSNSDDCLSNSDDVRVADEEDRGEEATPFPFLSLGETPSFSF